MLEAETPLMRVRALGAAAEALARRGDLDRAGEVMDHALRIAEDVADPPERARALCAVAEGMAAVCPVDDALRVADGIDPLRDRVGALGLVAEALARAGRSARAAEVLAAVPEADLDQEGRRALVKALASAGELERAMALAGRSADPSWAWDIIAHALLQAGRLEQAYATALLPIADLRRRGLVLLDLARALAASRQADRALEVAAHIAVPSYRCEALLAAAGALGDAGRTADALHGAAAAARAVADAGDHDRRLRTLALTWAERGDLDQARALVGRLKTDSQRRETRVALARLLIRQGRADRAVELLEEVPVPLDQDPRTGPGMEPDTDANAELLEQVAITLVQAGRLDRAVALARSMTGPPRRARALARVAREMAGRGHADRAGAVLDESATALLSLDGEDDVYHIHRLAELAEAMVGAGRTDRVGELLTEAERLIDTLYEDEERTEAWRVLVIALVRAGRFDRAEEVTRDRPSDLRLHLLLVRFLCEAGALGRAQAAASRIEEQETRSRARRTVVTALVAAGRLDEAESVADTVESAEPRAQALQETAAARARAGRLDRAVALLRRAESAVRSMTDSYRRGRQRRELVETLLAVGRLAQAAELRRRAETMAADLPAALAEILAASGRLDRALAMAVAIADPLEQCHALAAVGEAYARTGRSKGIFQTLLHARTVAAGVAAPEPRRLLQARVARAWAVTGHADEARWAMEQALGQDAPLSGPAAVAVAGALAALGRYEQALALAADRADPREAAAIRATVACRLAHSGDLTRGADLARAVPDPGLREWALAGVAHAVARAGDPDRALHLLHAAPA